ncbi:hypothetical protein [Gracilibacillus kekensis]|uniref:Uncharacterized protein n=1 Tax=Gracilibacillus kekensis TaxID=1027249 RepID=A0A1M7IIA5_9BACI|nr:hypothetical protein [Gracilibacillus kekensis]SHM40450.1 hypothetical protein SAMN05216179_0062 [Gracilibacillus kekensis]
MAVYIILILIICISAFLLTFQQLGRSDPNYREESKTQLKRLSMIYVVAIIGSVIALVIYMSVS